MASVGTRERVDRARSGWHKLHWGAASVGWPATARGLGRLATLKVRRPPEAAVRLRSGAELTFAYPSQCVPALVVFGDVIDPEFRLLELIARPDWVVVDVGAAIGQFTVFAARLPCATVHAYEPSGANLVTLRANVDHNGVAPKVVIHQCALSEVEGELVFATAATTYLSRLDHEAGAQGEVVAVRTLAAEMDRLGLDRVSILKVNVAGCEPEVLAGATEFLQAGRADVLILLIGLSSLPWYRTLLEWGYRLFFFHPVERRLHEIADFDQAFLHDRRPWPARHVIAVHQSAIDRGVVGRVEIVPASG